MKPPCVPWCLWYHHAHGTAVPVVLLYYLSSRLWATIAEWAAATEYPEVCNLSSKVASNELFSLLIPTVF